MVSLLARSPSGGGACIAGGRVVLHRVRRWPLRPGRGSRLNAIRAWNRLASQGAWPLKGSTFRHLGCLNLLGHPRSEVETT